MNLKKSRRNMVVLGMVACLLLLLSGTTGISHASPGILHVKPSATGSGDCSDWDNACTLQTALVLAGAGDEIWVAAGTHKPTDGMDRTATFQLKNGVALYGGFEGNETSHDQRDWTVHETILSGDIGTVGDNSDNSYHVVTGSGTDATAVLEGFTIAGGNASGSYPHNGGGGMHNYYGSPMLTNVTFSGNTASDSGGGMANYWSDPTLVNVTFSGNSADRYGGGVHTWESSPTLVNVTFSGNSASYWGGGMYIAWQSPTLVNVTFSGNSANYGGGMYNDDGSSPMLVNVTFSGNSASYWGGGMRNWAGSPMLVNVTFSGNSASSGGGMYSSWYSSPALTNSILWGNMAPEGAQIYNDDTSTATVNYSLVGGGCPSGATCDHILDADPEFVDAPNGDLHLQATSPAIDAGDNDAVPPDTLDLDGDGNTTEKLPCDLDGYPRFVDIPDVPDTGVGTPPIVDMGAYEAQAAQREVSIDIRPGSYPNSINLSSMGVVPVAVLTTENFDASTVDPATVLFADALPVRWTMEDVDADEDMDLLFHFKTQELNLDENSTEAMLEGTTYDGLPIWGVDTVNIVP